METRWTEEMERATREADDAPPRVALSGDRGTVVLLPDEDYACVRERVPGLPVTQAVLRPGTGQLYALVPLVVYSRIDTLFEDVPITLEERKAALKAAGFRAGWDDPIWDDFDREMNDYESK